MFTACLLANAFTFLFANTHAGATVHVLHPRRHARADAADLGLHAGELARHVEAAPPLAIIAAVLSGIWTYLKLLIMGGGGCHRAGSRRIGAVSRCASSTPPASAASSQSWLDPDPGPDLTLTQTPTRPDPDPDPDPDANPNPDPNPNPNPGKWCLVDTQMPDPDGGAPL